jgi:hypothetical protein
LGRRGNRVELAVADVRSPSGSATEAAERGDWDVPGSEVVGGGGVGWRRRATEVVNVEGSTGRETVGNTSTSDIEGYVANRAVGAVSTEVDGETETVNGGEANDGVCRDVGTKGEREDDWPCVISRLCVRTVVADH